MPWDILDLVRYIFGSFFDETHVMHHCMFPGAKGRLAGALLFDVALVGKLGMVIWGSLQFLGYF